MSDQPLRHRPGASNADGRGVGLLGRPILKTGGVVAQALAIGPVASLGLGGFLVVRYAGAAAPFVVVVSLVGALCLAWVVAIYARSYAGAGSVYEYVACTLGKPFGLACAGLEFFVGPLALGTLYLLVGVLWQRFSVTHFGSDPGWWVGGVAVAAAVFFLQYRGIRPATRTQLVLTAISAVPFLVLVAAVAIRGGPEGNSLGVFHPGAATGGELSRSFLFAVLLFAGFEASAAVGEETHDPHRSIPRGMLVTIATSGVFYVLVVYAAAIGFGTANVAREWGGNPSGLSLLADRYLGPPLGALIELAVLVNLVVVVSAYGNHLGRGLFALARDGLLPRVLAVRSGDATPVGGLAVGLAGGMAVLVAATAFEDRLVVVEALAVTLTLANMVVYLTLAAGAPRLRRDRRAGLLTASATVIPILGILGTVVPPPRGPGLTGVVLFAGVLVTVVAWVTVLRYRRPDRLEAAARYTLRATPTDSGLAGAEKGDLPEDR